MKTYRKPEVKIVVVNLAANMMLAISSESEYTHDRQLVRGRRGTWGNVWASPENN